jgi:NADH dehydrogenase
MALANRGYRVTLPCRRPQRLTSLKVLPGISLVEANILDQSQLNTLCKGHHVVINLVGILNQSRKNSFRKIHVDFVKSVVNACQVNRIKRLLHVSALGANQASGSSQYLRSKGEGENLIHTFGQKDLQVTSFQPSVIFGEDDSFINRFAEILKLCIALFPLACPASRFSPVYIGDLVAFIADTIENPNSYGKRYPLCGPETWTLQQIVQMINDAQGSHCRVVGLPNSIARLQAMMLQNLPGKLFTVDNFRSLQTPSVCPELCPPCQTSFSNYLAGLSCRFNRKAVYNLYRQQSNR